MRLVQVMAALAADAGMPGALVPAAAVLSCVVPALERPWKAALSRTCTGRVLTVGPGLKTGMPVHYDDPAEIGPDRIADAVAARAVYGSPCIVIDLGTTTNIEVIDARGTFVGGVIAPGLALGAVRSRPLRRACLRLSPQHRRMSSAATRVKPCARVWFWARWPASMACSTWCSPRCVRPRPRGKAACPSSLPATMPSACGAGRP